MSLKSFHLVFIAASLVLAFAFGFWGVNDYRLTGESMNLYLGVASLLVGIALIPYTIWFLRKNKKVSYL